MQGTPPPRLPHPWVVEAELAEGGQSRVFRVRDPGEGVVRALKIPREPGDAAWGRLRREASQLSRLRHPNVVGAVGLLEVDGAPALLLEWVDGPTLADRLRAGPLGPEEAERLADGLLAAVEAVHAAGLVHRDLKADNVVLEGGVVPRLLDLGFARGPRCLRHTASEDVVGTEAAAAPEQLRGADPHPTADVWSLGCLLFRLLTGHEPFDDDGRDALQRFLARCDGRFRDPAGLAPLLPAHRAELLRSALDPDPARRPADAGVLRRAWHAAERQDAPPRAREQFTGELFTRSVGHVDSHGMPSVDDEGRWMLEAPLGEGAGGRVFLAQNTTSGERAAVKVFHVGAGPRWREEVRALQRVRSRRVTRVRGTTSVRGSPALVMEWVDAEPLRDRVAASGPLSLDELDRVAERALAGLVAIHDASIVHRDLSPSNVLVGRDDEGPTAWITDFGLAKSDEGPPLTRTGALVGTPGYVAPEQIRRPSQVDARADLFSLGAVLFFAATGEDPFTGSSAWDALNATIHGRHASLRGLRPELPARMELAILGALAADPARRIPDARTMLRVWSGLRPWPERRPVLWWMVSAFGTAAAASWMLLGAHDGAPPTQPEPSAEVARLDGSALASEAPECRE